MFGGRVSFGMDQLWAKIALLCGLLAGALGAAFVPLALRLQLDISDFNVTLYLSLAALPALVSLASVTQYRQGGVANALLLWALVGLYAALMDGFGPAFGRYMWPALVFMALSALASVGTLRVSRT